jgi:catechol 2,3-dioxygenase-like lactoylglutathione lyase family enzyme
MTAKAGYSTPILHAADISRSMQFYRLLGFETVDTDGEDGNLGWARMHCEGGALMFLAAEEPAGPAHPSVMLYLYTPDLPALREHLLANGVEVPPIGKPPYMPSGEICLRDPDGNTVLVGHWGEKEHQEWLERISEKKQAGRL